MCATFDASGATAVAARVGDQCLLVLEDQLDSQLCLAGIAKTAG